jgi:UDP-galactopyranose mutase
VLFGGALIDYPFQQHLDQISDKTIAAECESTLPRGHDDVAATNFEEWIFKRFGDGVARHFMLPYNRKLWARDLKRMSCEWVGERIAPSDPAKPHDAPGRAPLRRDNEVSYPAEGGFVEIYRAMARRCGPIEFGEDVIRIDPASKTAETASGRIWFWHRLVSTMPLPALLRAIAGCPEALIAAADRLEFVSLKIVMLVIGQRLGEQPQRIYVADPQVPTHKIAFNHTSSPSLRARPRHGVMCEVAYSREKPPLADGELVQRTLECLVEHRLIGNANDLVEARVLDVPYGYPVYTQERPQILQRIEAFLAGHGIRSIGRFGHWDYVNSDGCIWQAHELAKHFC